MKQFTVEYIDKYQGRVKRKLDAIDWIGIPAECMQNNIMLETVISIEILSEDYEE